MTQLLSFGFGHHAYLAIACFLIKEGNGDVNQKNRKGKSALDLLEQLKNTEFDSSNSLNQIKDYIHQLIESRNSRRSQSITLSASSSDEQAGVSQSSVSQSANDNQLSNKATPPSSDFISHQIDCVICNDILANVVFQPCKHQICCEDCCFRMKKCVKCGQAIVAKQVIGEKKSIQSSFKELSLEQLGKIDLKKAVNVERLMYLESKIAEIEEANSCTICMERPRNVVFLCGHGACANCAQPLKTCHMCRKSISKKINLY